MIRLDVQPFTSHFTHPAGYPTGYDAAGNPVRSHHLSLEFRFHYSASHSNAVVIIPFEQAACSTSRRTTRPRPPLADRRAQAPAVSDDEEGADIISPDAQATSQLLDMELLGAAGRSRGA